MVTKPTLTYLYCLVRSTRRPSLRGGPGGLPEGSPLRLIDAGDRLWLVVSDVPAGDYAASVLEARLRDLEWVGLRAVAHSEVNAHFAGRATMLPVRFLTIFRTDARALGHVRRRRRMIDRALDRVGACFEWGVRIAAPTPEASPGGARTRPLRSGTAFLARKLDLKAAAETRAARARAGAEQVYAALEREARETRRRADYEDLAAGNVLVDAVYLVPREQTDRFRTAVRKGARLLGRDGPRIAVNGPFPAFSFVDE